jgi:mRNA interferase MazF
LKIRRGEIWLANLDPRFGTEAGKTRPVLVVQSQVLLDVGYSSALVIPLTTRLIEDAEPVRMRLRPSGRLHRESDLLIAQMRAMDTRRLMQGPLTRLEEAMMSRVAAAIRDVLELP